MNLQEHIRRVVREESISVNMKTVQSDLINMIGPSKIKIVNTIGSFNSSFKIIVDHLDQEILDKINNYMNENGWFPHSIGLSNMKERIYSQNVKNYIGEDDVQIGYESNTPEGINTTQTKAFHVTPDIFLDKIMETGLTLKSEGKLSDHPNRIYLFLNGDKNTQKGIVWAIWNSLSKERQETIKNYYVLEIDLTQIPNHKIYRDPQAFITYEAVYVDQPIPKSAIKVIDKIDTSNIETENDIDMTKEEEKIARDEKKRKEEESIEQQKNSDLTYDQFEKSVEKLPDNLKNMNIDDLMNLQEHIRRIIREESGLSPRFLRRVPMDKLEESFGHALKQATKKYYRYLPTLNDDYKLHFFTKEVVELLLDSVSHLMYPTIKGSWYDEEFSKVKEHFKDRITEWWENLN